MSGQAEDGHGNPPGLVTGIVITLVLIPLIAAYLGLAYAFDIQAGWAGFTFILYWTGLKAAAPKEYLPTLVGSLGGLALAYGCHWLPAQGTAGGLLLMVLILAAMYLMVRGQLSMLVNYAFMLFLTVGNIPELAKGGDYIDIAEGILLGAAYSGLLLVIAGKIGQWRTGRTAQAAPAE